MNAATYAAARPDLPQNWIAANDRANPNYESPLYRLIRSYGTLDAYLENDYATGAGRGFDRPAAGFALSGGLIVAGLVAWYFLRRK